MRHIVSRAADLLAATLAAAALLSACADGDENVAADAEAPVSVSCAGLNELPSYRYTVKVELTSPTVAASPIEGGLTDTPAATADPIAALSDALTGLFSEFTIQGAYVAPDRSQALFQFQGQEIELRSIDERWWLRLGARWQADDAAAVAGDLLTPVVVCEKIVSVIVRGLTGAPGSEEEVGGARTDRYHLTASDAGELAPLLGAAFSEYTVDLWLAHEGRWPARLLLQSRGGAANGETFRLSMELEDIGSDEIEIVQPLADY